VHDLMNPRPRIS